VRQIRSQDRAWPIVFVAVALGCSNDERVDDSEIVSVSDPVASTTPTIEETSTTESPEHDLTPGCADTAV
jgi:hypothetical protein